MNRMTLALAVTVACTLPQLAVAEATLTLNIQQVSSWVKNFNPYNVTTRLQSTREFVYEPLAVYNVMEQGKPYYRLATGETFSDDLMALTYTLRESARWSDGELFTSEDVVFSFNMLKQHPELDTTGVWERLARVEANGDQEVTFHLSKVNTGVNVRIVEVPIVAEHIWSQVEDPVSFTNEEPVGTGPFTEITRFTPQVYVQCRNPHYWDNANLNVDCLRLPQLATNDNTMAAATQGELDWFGSFLPDIERTYVARNKENHKYWFPGGSLVSMIMNHETAHEGNREAFTDRTFRRAFSMVMDRDAMVNVAGYGYPTLNDYASGIGETYAAWSDDSIKRQYQQYMEYNVDEARSMLAAAGYTDSDGDGYLNTPSGKPIELVIQVPNGWTDWVNTSQIAAEGLQELGIKAQIGTPEAAVWRQKLISGEFDAAINSYFTGTTPHQQYDTAFHSRYKGTSRFAASRYNHPDLDKELDTFFTLTSLEEQKQVMAKIQRILAEDMPYVPVFNNPMWYQYNDSRFTGWWTADNPKGRPQPHSGNAERLLHVLDLKPRG